MRKSPSRRPKLAAPKLRAGLRIETDDIKLVLTWPVRTSDNYASLDDDPSLVNSDPYGDGWMIKLRVDDDEEVRALLSSDGYADHIG